MKSKGFIALIHLYTPLFSIDYLEILNQENRYKDQIIEITGEFKRYSCKKNKCDISLSIYNEQKSVGNVTVRLDDDFEPYLNSLRSSETVFFNCNYTGSLYKFYNCE
jgi:hypothetical protein